MCQKEIRPHFSCTFRQHTHNGLKNKNRKVPKISNKRKSKYKNKIKNNNSNTALKKRDLLTAGDGITFFGYLFVTAIYTGDWRVHCTWLFEKKSYAHTYIFIYLHTLFVYLNSGKQICNRDALLFMGCWPPKANAKVPIRIEKKILNRCAFANEGKITYWISKSDK